MLVYVTALSADIAAGDESRGPPQAAGEIRIFDLPLSGWYWQIGPAPGQALRDMRTSLSLVGATLPPLGADAPRRPGDRDPHRLCHGTGRAAFCGSVEREVIIADDTTYTITLAGPSEEITADVRSFSIAITLTFALLGMALALSTLFQIRFGLLPLQRLRAALAGVRRGGGGGDRRGLSAVISRRSPRRSIC